MKTEIETKQEVVIELSLDEAIKLCNELNKISPNECDQEIYKFFINYENSKHAKNNIIDK